MNRKIVVFSLMLPILAGCETRDDKTQLTLVTLRADVGALKAELQQEKEAREALAAQVGQLAKNPANSETAYLDPAERGYALVQTDVAPLLLSFDDARPIGDGTRIRLNVGNIAYAEFGGVELSITYNHRMPLDNAGPDEWARWRENAREAKVTASETLRPGTWNKVEAGLPGIKPEELGFLAVKADLNRAVLFNTPRAQ